MSTGTVGEQLKRARTARQLSLQDVVKATKIQPWVVEALERNELHTTMSAVYVKSFLASYARFLGLEPQALLAQLFPTPASAPVTDAPSRAPGPAWSPDPGQLWPLLSRLGVGLLGVAAVVVLSRAHPIHWLSSRLPRQEASVSIAKKAPPAVADRETALHLEPAQPMELAIIARRPTWMSLKADGKLVAQQQLLAGANETWKARRRFELIIGAPSRVEVLLNGHPISSLALAHQGRLTITHQGIKSLDSPATPAARVQPASSTTSSR